MMGKWGWMIISIGCIIMMYSQTNEDFHVQMSVLLSGLAFVGIGGIMSYIDIKKNKTNK